MDQAGHPSIADRVAPPLDFPADPAPETRPRQNPSLVDDITAFLSDGKTYLRTELAFQKSRAGYSASQAKSAVVFALGALAFLHLALIALTVGLVFALSTVMGPWFATAIVVAGLILVGGIFALQLRKRIASISSVFGEHTS